MKRLAALAMLLAAFGGGCGGAGAERIILGAGTTVVDSGFVDAVVAAYEEATDGRVAVVAESSQRLLDLARRGEVDFLITHEPDALAAFIAEGFAGRSDAVFESQFLLVGPPELTAGLAGSDAAAAFSTIAAGALPFVSRADGSGTYGQELDAWAASGVDPTNEPWYQTTGQGMGLTMQVADQRDAFVVVERGAWLEAADTLSLVEVDIGDWPNLYSATVVAGDAAEAADEFFDWLFSDAGGETVDTVNEELFGQPVYRNLFGERSLP